MPLINFIALKSETYGSTEILEYWYTEVNVIQKAKPIIKKIYRDMYKYYDFCDTFYSKGNNV